jgi:FkbM family methyltransferase
MWAFIYTALAKRRITTPPDFDPRWLGQTGEFKQHHPVFSMFPPFSGSVSVNVAVDYIGMKSRPEYLQSFTPRAAREITCAIPPIDEEYFEWIDLLQSVRDAGERYTMLELGAGYGRWGARAVLAARQAGIKNIHIGLVEAEPVHVQWLRLHLAENEISPEQATIYNCAVSDANGWAEFYVGMPDGFGVDTPREWFGQSIAGPYEASNNGFQDQTETYHGHSLLTYKSGYRAIRTRKMDIRDLLTQYDEIDLLDLDVQGEELKVIAAGSDVLDSRVKRLHIGTHGQRIEIGLRKLLRNRGWLLLRDYGFNRKNPTPFGEVTFGDGVQSWVNTRFRVSIA